jgi:hypothetical protein
MRVTVGALVFELLPEIKDDYASVYNVVHLFKQLLKKRVKDLRWQLPVIIDYPILPRDLPADVFAHAYGDSVPRNTDVDGLQAYLSKVPMRSTNKDLREPSLQMQAVGSRQQPIQFMNMLQNILQPLVLAMQNNQAVPNTLGVHNMRGVQPTRPSLTNHQPQPANVVATLPHGDSSAFSLADFACSPPRAPSVGSPTQLQLALPQSPGPMTQHSAQGNQRPALLGGSPPAPTGSAPLFSLPALDDAHGEEADGELSAQDQADIVAAALADKTAAAAAKCKGTDKGTGKVKAKTKATAKAKCKASGKVTAKGKAKPKVKSTTSTVKGGKKAKDVVADMLVWNEKTKHLTRGAYTSRAYDTCKRRLLADGCSDAAAKSVAKEAYQISATIFDNHK